MVRKKTVGLEQPKNKNVTLVLAVLVVVLLFASVGAYLTYNHLKKTIVKEIVVAESEIDLTINKEYQLEPIIYPESANKALLTYTSEDEEIATVSTDGLVKITDYFTGMRKTVRIKIESNNGISNYVTINVTNPYAVIFSGKTVKYKNNKTFVLQFQNRVARCIGFDYILQIEKVTKGKNKDLENKKFIIYGRDGRNQWVKLGVLIYEKVGEPTTVTLSFPEVALTEVICVLENKNNLNGGLSWSASSFLVAVKYLK